VEVINFQIRKLILFSFLYFSILTLLTYTILAAGLIDESDPDSSLP